VESQVCGRKTAKDTNVTSIKKARVVELLLSALEKNKEEMFQIATSNAAEATHEESRAENDKDTRGLEASYLARGQAQRTVEIESAIKSLEYMPLTDFSGDQPIASSALVKLLNEDDEEWIVFLSPWGGGTILHQDGIDIRVVGPQSPLGRALLGKRTDDNFEIKIKGAAKEFEILEIY